jgi:hypothetical protein
LVPRLHVMPCVIVLQHHVDVVQLHCASSSIAMSMSYSRPCTMGMLAWSTNGGDQGKNHGYNSLTDILSFTGTHASSLRESISYLGGYSCGPAVLHRRHSCSGGCSQPAAYVRSYTRFWTRRAPAAFNAFHGVHDQAHVIKEGGALPKHCKE